jgi:hypothetical protein
VRIFEVGDESRKDFVIGDGGGLWAVRKSPSTTFFQTVAECFGSDRKVPAPQQSFNPFISGAKRPPLLVWLAKHRSARRPGVVI